MLKRITWVLSSLVSLFAVMMLVGNAWDAFHPVIQGVANFHLSVFYATLLFTGLNTLQKHPSRFPLLALMLVLLAMVQTSPSGRDLRLNDTNPSASGPKVVSLNVNQFENDSALADEVATYLQLLDADVILLQEFGLYHKWPNVDVVREAFAKKLRMPFAHFEPHKDNIFGTAIFSKLPIAESNLVFQNRGSTNEAWHHIVLFEGRNWHLVNVHLESYNLRRKGFDFARLKEVVDEQRVQLNSVETTLQNHNTDRWMVVGDFNASAMTPLFKPWRNTYHNPFRYGASMLLPTMKSLPLQLDHAWMPKEMMDVDAYVDYNAPSDHATLVMQW